MRKCLIGLLLLLGLSLHARDEAPAFLEGTCGSGSLKQEGNLWVLRVSGTPEEIGTQEGTHLREPIRALIQGYLTKRIGEGKIREEAVEKAR